MKKISDDMTKYVGEVGRQESGGPSEKEIVYRKTLFPMIADGTQFTREEKTAADKARKMSPIVRALMSYSLEVAKEAVISVRMTRKTNFLQPPSAYAQAAGEVQARSKNKAPKRYMQGSADCATCGGYGYYQKEFFEQRGKYRRWVKTETIKCECFGHE